MNPGMLAISVALILIIANPCAFAQPPQAETLLDAMDDAIGAAKVRAKQKTLLSKGKISVPGMKGAGSFEERYLGDKLTLWKTDWPGLGKSLSATQGCNGEFSWSTDPAQGIYTTNGADQGAVKRMFAIGRRSPWRSMYASARVVGETKILDRKHWQLEMTALEAAPQGSAPASRPTGTKETWYLDAQTHFPTQVDLMLPDMMGGTMACSLIYEDWKAVSGISFPFTKTQKIGSYSIKHSYDSIEVNGTVSPADVAPSDEIVAAFKNPKKNNLPPTKPTEPNVELRAPVHVVSITVKIKPSEVGPTLEKVLPEVINFLVSSGASMAGSPFTRYHSITKDELEIEAGIPVTKKTPGKGRVKSSLLPGGRVASTWHFGSFETLSTTHKKLADWAAKKGLLAAPGPWEIYRTDPGIEPDESKWRTEVVLPLQKLK